jgi:DNA-binding winged helix-turn-helix (wHTH) protein/TolB-like protein
MAPTGLYRFGGFTFDSASGDLKSAGQVTRVKPQVAALLLILIEHAGAVVSRAELQARLWPDTTVEFDEGINFCVRQLRVALDDDAAAPRFIETLPKRGYRFLAAVTKDGAPNLGEQVTSIAPTTAPAPRTPRRLPRPAIAILVGFVALELTAALVAFVQSRRHPGPARTHDAIVLAVLPFATDTTDPMMVTYRQRMTDQILADARTEQGWQTVTAAAPSVTHVLSGTLTRHGNSVQIFVEVVRAGTRQHVWADDIVDSYAFSGNSTLTADRIEQSTARVLGVRH